MKNENEVDFGKFISILYMLANKSSIVTIEKISLYVVTLQQLLFND